MHHKGMTIYSELPDIEEYITHNNYNNSKNNNNNNNNNNSDNNNKPHTQIANKGIASVHHKGMTIYGELPDIEEYITHNKLVKRTETTARAL